MTLEEMRTKELRERAASLYDAAHRVRCTTARRQLLHAALAAAIEAERIAPDVDVIESRSRQHQFAA